MADGSFYLGGIALDEFEAPSKYATQAAASATAAAASATAAQTAANQAGDAGRNFLYNSSFDFQQRGAGPFAIGSSTFVADRWRGTRFGVAGSTFTRIAAGANDASRARYAMRVQRNSGDAALQTIAISQVLTNADSLALAGRTVALSAYLSKGANFSEVGGRVTMRIVTGTGVEESGGDAMLLSGWTGQAFHDLNQVITSTRTRYTHTVVIPSGATEIGVAFFYVPTGTAGAADYFEIAGIKLELDGAATPYDAPDIPTELNRCLRFYEKSVAHDVALVGLSTGYIFMPTGGANVPSGGIVGVINFRTEKRANPTVTIRPFTTVTNTARVSDGVGTDLAASSGATNDISRTRARIINSSGGVLTANSTMGFICHYEADAEI